MEQHPPRPTDKRPYAAVAAAGSVGGIMWQLRQVRADMARAEREASIVRTLEKKDVANYVHERYKPYAKLALRHATVISLWFGVAATAGVVLYYDLRSPREVTERLRDPMTSLRTSIKDLVVPWSQRLIDTLKAPLTRSRKSVDESAQRSGVTSWVTRDPVTNDSAAAAPVDPARVDQERAVLKWLAEAGAEQGPSGRALADRRKALDSVAEALEAAGPESGTKVAGAPSRPANNNSSNSRKSRAEEWSDSIRDWVLGRISGNAGPDAPKPIPLMRRLEDASNRLRDRVVGKKKE